MDKMSNLLWGDILEEDWESLSIKLDARESKKDIEDEIE